MQWPTCQLLPSSVVTAHHKLPAEWQCCAVCAACVMGRHAQVFGAGSTQLELAEALDSLPLAAAAGSTNAAVVLVGHAQSGKGHTLYGPAVGKPADAGVQLLTPSRTSPSAIVYPRHSCVSAGYMHSQLSS